MKEYKYDCDGGSVCIGNKFFQVCIPNNFGDGCHSLKVFNINERWSSHAKDIEKYWEWKGAVKGCIHVYNYDCLTKDEIADEKNTLCVLHGRYAIYVAEGNVALIQWD